MPEAETLQLHSDICGAFAADPNDIARQCISFYVPNKDRDGNEIGNQRKWVLELENLLSEINGGATAMPPVEGVWKNDQTEKLIAEHPVVVYSFIRPEAFLQRLPQLADFIHRLGRETNQGEIGFEFDGCFYRIKEFRAASGGGK